MACVDIDDDAAGMGGWMTGGRRVNGIVGTVREMRMGGDWTVLWVVEWSFGGWGRWRFVVSEDVSVCRCEYFAMVDSPGLISTACAYDDDLMQWSLRRAK